MERGRGHFRGMRESVGSRSTNDKFCSPFLSPSHMQVKIARAEDGF